MIIKSIDTVVNAVPNCSADIARKLLVEIKPGEENDLSKFEEVLGSRLVGYLGGVGFQAVTIGGFTGYQTNSITLGVLATGASAAVPMAVKAAKLTSYVISGSYFRKRV